MKSDDPELYGSASYSGGGSVTPESVAIVLRRYPSERDAILRLLHQTRGNAFVQQVLAAGRAGAR